MLGQLRPGNGLTLLYRSDEDASRELREKHAYWAAWLPDVASVCVGLVRAARLCARPHPMLAFTFRGGALIFAAIVVSSHLARNNFV